MWIILTKKLPTAVSPPKLSIFWSVPWVDEKRLKQQRESYMAQYVDMYAGTRVSRAEMWQDVLEKMDVFFPPFYGLEANAAKDRAIMYHGDRIRVHVNEYNPVDKERMSLYVLGTDDGDPSHYLNVDASSVADEIIVKEILEGELRPIYEAALIDGCTHAQAMATAMGIDITLPEPQFPPVGWYSCHPEYAKLFCEPWEMEG